MTEGTERRAAHERLSTGGLARWMRRCATHPWRVVGAWVGILVVLVVLVISFAGIAPRRVRDPWLGHAEGDGPDRGRVRREQGGVLNVVFAAPPGQRLDTPERKQAIDEAITKLRGAEFKPTEDKAGLESVATRSPRTPSQTTGASPTRRPSSTASSTTRIATRSSPFRTLSARRSSRRA